MLGVRDGEVEALGTLFDRHHSALFNFFLRLTGNRQLAEDLVQEVFFRMLKYRRSYRDQSQFTSWMYQIARHVRFDHLSKRQKEVQLDDDHEEPSSREPLPGSELEHLEDVFLLRQALARLAPDKREILVLSRFQKLKYEAIAEILGCEVGAVKVRVFRAVRELRDTFFELQGKRAS
jgi:RNA polymerase sigma-70 factor (ECF subfamily)